MCTLWFVIGQRAIQGPAIKGLKRSMNSFCPAATVGEPLCFSRKPLMRSAKEVDETQRCRVSERRTRLHPLLRPHQLKVGILHRFSKPGTHTVALVGAYRTAHENGVLHECAVGLVGSLPPEVHTPPDVVRAILKRLVRRLHRVTQRTRKYSNHTPAGPAARTRPWAPRK